MAWGAVLSGLRVLIVVLLRLGRYGWARVLILFQSGFWRYVGVFVFVVAVQWPAVEASVAAGSLMPFIVSVGGTLGSSVSTVMGNAAALPSAAGLEYVELLSGIAVSVATVLWYFRSVSLVVRFIDRDASPLLVYGGAAAIYILTVFAVTGWMPSAGTVDTLWQMVESLDVARLNPWFEPVNQTANLTN